VTTVHRAYSLIDVTKAFDPSTRTFHGIATSPVPDRVGDVIESDGLTFAKTLPLLLYHDHKKPVGEVSLGRPGKDGTPFAARISTVDKDSGVVAERLAEAVDSLSAKPPLIRAVSIGFRELEPPSFIKETGGFRFSKVEILELSMVVVPAHQEATIANVKSIFNSAQPPVGGDRAITPNTPPVGSAVVANTKATGRPMTKKTIADQIREFESTRAAKVAERDAIMDGAAEKGLTLDATETEQYDALDVEVKSIDEHLKRLRAREVENASAAVVVKGANPLEASLSRNGGAPVIHMRVNREPGIGFARFTMAKMRSYMEMKSGNFVSALEVAQKLWPSDTELHTHIKTSIPAGTSTETTWATELVEPTTLGSEFLEFLRAQTIIGKFGMNGVPSLRSLPFNIRIARMTSGLTGYWVGEGLGKPVSKGAVDAVTLPYTKVAALSVITQELARFSSPSAERLVRDELAKSVSARIDTDFVDPAIAATSAKPASITNGLTALSSAGTSADNARTDLANLIEYFILNHMDVSSLVVLMPNTLALSLSLLRNSLGQQEFPGLTMNGGRLEGIPVITSQYLASGASFGNMVIALSANDIGLADDGAVDVKVSDQATIEMTDSPAGDSGTPTAGSTNYVSMFQTNSLAILAERFITWKKLRSTAVVFMDDVNWGAIGSPV
jgi:HK97 family phage major capsid protein